MSMRRRSGIIERVEAVGMLSVMGRLRNGGGLKVGIGLPRRAFTSDSFGEFSGSLAP